METYLTIDLEERIRLYEEEKRKIEETVNERIDYYANNDESHNHDDFNGYVADWYIE